MKGQYYAVVRSGQNDEIRHWKYIKKYKKNGKWRYVYNVGSTGNKIDGEKQSPYREYSKLQDMLGYDERDSAAIADINYRRKSENATSYNHSQSKNPFYKQSESNKLYKQADIAQKKASKAIKRYYKTPLGKLDKLDDRIDEGRNIVANALSKLSKRIRPKKESFVGKTTNYSVTRYEK